MLRIWMVIATAVCLYHYFVHETSKEALNLVRWMKANPHDRLAGLSVDGNEAASKESNRILYSAFCEARAAGMGITVHAGESSPAEGVWEALDI